MPRTLIVAEAGVNHNGSLDMAFRLVDACAEAGADAVKFQTFRAAQLVSAGAPKAQYQTRTTDPAESQLAMLQRLELDEGAFHQLARRCQERGIEFMSTPFDVESLQLLLRLGVRRLKIGSGDLTNAVLLYQAARTGLPIVLSTGMSELGDVELALGVLAYGYLGGESPKRAEFVAAYRSAAGQELLRQRVLLLHCCSEYPAPPGEINLRALETLRCAFGLPVGYSDHTAGLTVPIAAVALGAAVLEKHVTLDRSLPGPDHAASIEPAGLRLLVAAVRETEAALGDGRKTVGASEAKNQAVARKSLVALRPIARGERFTSENLGVKRPGTGISPTEFWDWLGKPAARAYVADEVIDS